MTEAGGPGSRPTNAVQQGPSRRATLLDIAKMVGVSEATVSRALREDPQIRERTRAAVRLAAAELAYVPNHAAQSLARASTATLGLMVPDVVDSVHGSVVTGFEREAAAHGYAVIIVSGLRNPDSETRGFDLFRRYQVDGTAVVGMLSSIEVAQKMLAPPPLVLIESEGDVDPGIVGAAGDATAILELDYEQGVADLMAHLHATGRSRVAYLSGPSLRSNRVRGDLVRGGLRSGQEFVGIYDSDPHAREYEQTVDILLRERPDAVVCYDDERALYLLAALRSRGIAVPQEIAVSGFDDVPFARLSTPSLTTIRQPAEKLGGRAARLILGWLGDDQVPMGAESASLQLVVRQSTADTA